jgi:hypothetical protein
MARRQYTPGTKARGFNAVPVSNANLAQLEAEGNRVLQNMQAQRNADLENRQRTLNDMQSNANYTQNALDRNFQIASNNETERQKQIQYDEAERQRRFEEASKGTAQVFKSLANLSFTAGQKFKALGEEEDKTNYRKGLYEGLATAGSMSQEKLLFLAKLNDQDALSSLLENNAALAKEKGYDPNAIARVINMSAKQRAGFFYGSIQQQTKTQYSAFYNKQIADPNNTILINGEQVPYSQALGEPALLGAVQQEIADKWIKTNQWPENHDMLGGAYQEMATIHGSAITVATTQQTKAFNADTLQRWDNAAFTDFARYGGEAFRMHVKLETPEAAHTWYKKRSTLMNPDGTFVLSEAQVRSTDVYGVGTADGKKGSYEDDFPKRTIELFNARADKYREWLSNQTKTEKVEYQQESRAWWEEYQNNQTAETLAAAEESFSDNQEGPPEWIARAKKGLEGGQYIQNLKVAAKDAEQRGILTQALVTEVFGYDPKEGNRLQEALDKQNPFNKSEVYKEQRKGLSRLTKKPSATVQFPQDSSHTLHASRILGREFDNLVSNLATQYGGDQAAIEKASVEAAGILEGKLAADATKPDGRYYREYNPITGLFTFPNLKDGNLTPSQEAKETAIQFQEAINKGRRKDLINTKFGVLTEAELNKELENFNKPGYTPNVKLVLASQGVDGGLPAVLQRQATLAGMSDQLGDMPESLQRVGAYSPSAQKLLSRYLNAEVSTRIHGYEGGKLAVEWNRHIVPAQYRESIEAHAKTFGVTPAILSAQLEVESSWNPNAGSVAGARGLAQFMPETARQYGVNVNDPDSSIKGMANYMRDLTQQFGDPITAAGAYNAGPGRMKEYLENGRPLPSETVNHMRKVAKAYYKYSGDARVLSNPHAARSGTSFQAANMAATYEGMDTSEGPDAGENACVYAINKVLRSSGIQPPWGDDLYVPTVKANLDANAKQISGPVPGAIVIMQDNGTPPYPHIGIVGNDGMIISNSSSARKFNWKMTPAQYEQHYGKPNLYYRLN